MLRYRYPNEDWIEIDADRYVLESSEQDTCYGNTYRPYGNVYYNNGNVLKWGAGGQDYFFKGKVNNVIYPENPTKSVQIKLEIITANEETYIFKANPYSITGGQESYSVSGTRIRATKFIESIDINEYLLIEGDNICPSQCILKMFKNERLILELTKDVCPEVQEIETNQCPENTCEVVCGDTICCYGSDGIAVDSFPIP